MLTLTLIHKCTSTSGVVLPAGITVEYLGHVVGGNVQVKYCGQTFTINPNATKELNKCLRPSQKLPSEPSSTDGETPKTR